MGGGKDGNKEVHVQDDLNFAKQQTGKTQQNVIRGYTQMFISFSLPPYKKCLFKNVFLNKAIHLKWLNIKDHENIKAT